MALRYEIANDIILEHITVERTYDDENTHIGYRLTTHDGYVMYDTSEENFTLDENGNEVPIIYYYRQAYMTSAMPVSAWTWVAVPESEVPADNIFGGGDNEETI